MEKMTKKEIIEWLNDLAERARTAYIKSGDDLARKDNDCIMAAIDIIERPPGEAPPLFGAPCAET